MLCKSKISAFILVFLWIADLAFCAPRQSRTNVTEKALLSVEILEDITSGAVVFPDSEESMMEPFTPIRHQPKCASGSTFCEDIRTYPYKYLKRMLKIALSSKQLYGVDEGPIENRLGDPDENFLCGSIDRVIFPKVAKNKYDKWKYIINQGEDDFYKQGVRIETCIRPSGPCKLQSSTPDGYITTCKQKYLYRRLLALSDSGQQVQDTFQMPSACCCSYRRDPYFFTDFFKK